MNIVIGSGPSGMASAHALLEQGERVLLLDAGIRVESEQENLLSKIRQGDTEAVERLKSLHLDTPISKKGVELKLAYGSDFAYRNTGKHLGFEGIHTGLLPSLAQGGLSNVWGAAVLPYIQKDIADWPITVTDLARHYEAVLKITGLAARRDDLADAFPLYATQLNRLDPSSQARDLMAGLEKMKSSLHQDGITYGRSRLAVGPNQTHNRDCVYCGQCLYGCPYSLIYNSAMEIQRLATQASDAFSYQPNIIVETIAGMNGKATVSGYDRLSGNPVQFEAEQVFLAAGVIPSSRIMLKSLEAYDQPLLLNDSQYFILPILSASGHGEAPSEALHTLSQIFLEIEDQNISPYTIHLQVYTYNDIISKVLKEKLWFAPGLRELLVQPLRHRLIVIQGYLHSAHSGTMSLRLTRDPGTGKDRLIVQGQPNVGVKKIIGQITRKLTRHFLKLGLMPLSPAVDITLPGRGFHSGGSFPMRARPAGFESDRYGCVPGIQRVHLVDASVFPSIPATTITLTAMANAHRIASTWKAGLS